VNPRVISVSTNCIVMSGSHRGDYARVCSVVQVYRQSSDTSHLHSENGGRPFIRNVDKLLIN
jgi:hypothetical protein